MDRSTLPEAFIEVNVAECEDDPRRKTERLHDVLVNWFEYERRGPFFVVDDANEFYNRLEALARLSDGDLTFTVDTYYIDVTYTDQQIPTDDSP